MSFKSNFEKTVKMSQLVSKIDQCTLTIIFFFLRLIRLFTSWSWNRPNCLIKRQKTKFNHRVQTKLREN